MSNKILITGGAGYIGSHAVKLFLEKGYKVVVFDNLSHGHGEPLKILKKFGALKFVKGDLKNKDDLKAVFKNHKIDAVLHFAALCSVDESVKQPELYFSNNTLGSANLLEVMREHNVKTVIFSSTCAVYGETQKLPVDEQHPLNPASPYGESKLLTEKILKWYGKQHDFKYVILRYFNVCGADIDGIIGDSKEPSEALVQNVVRGAMKIEPFLYTCSEVDTPDKTPVRDYIDINDLVAAHYLAYNYLQQGGQNDVFNLGNGVGYSVKKIVSEVEKIFKIKIPKQQAEPRQGEIAAIYANSQKARDVLGWKAVKSLEDSILSLKKWYGGFPEGYEN